MLDMSEAEIQTILTKYKEQRNRNKERYERVKDTEEFKMQNRARAKEHYESNKDKRKEKYQNNKDLAIARNSFYYYKRTNKLDTFKEKYPERYDLCVMYNYLSE